MNISYDLELHPGLKIKGKWNKNEYTLIRMLGIGENGTVCLVKHNDKEFALKMSLTPMDISYEIQALQRLNQAQGRALGFYVFDTDDFLFMGDIYSFYVMPYEKGVSIKRFLPGRNKREYLLIFKKIIQALEVLHQAEWAYGDMKPEHIIIDPTNKKISLIDFGGITKFNEGIRQYTDIYDRGNWKQGNRKADSHYDLYSVAMVFVEIVIGRKKLMKTYNKSRSIKEVYDIIPNIHVLKNLAPVLQRILTGNLTHTKDVLKELEILSQHLNEKSNDSHRWIDISLTFSIFIFILSFITVLYLW